MDRTHPHVLTFGHRTMIPSDPDHQPFIQHLCKHAYRQPLHVHFSYIEPIGLSQNAASFRHLCDRPEAVGRELQKALVKCSSPVPG